MSLVAHKMNIKVTRYRSCAPDRDYEHLARWKFLSHKLFTQRSEAPSWIQKYKTCFSMPIKYHAPNGLNVYSLRKWNIFKYTLFFYEYNLYLHGLLCKWSLTGQCAISIDANGPLIWYRWFKFIPSWRYQRYNLTGALLSKAILDLTKQRFSKSLDRWYVFWPSYNFFIKLELDNS